MSKSEINDRLAAYFRRNGFSLDKEEVVKLNKALKAILNAEKFKLKKFVKAAYYLACESLLQANVSVEVFDNITFYKVVMKWYPGTDAQTLKSYIEDMYGITDPHAFTFIETRLSPEGKVLVSGTPSFKEG